MVERRTAAHREERVGVNTKRARHRRCATCEGRRRSVGYPVPFPAKPYLRLRVNYTPEEEMADVSNKPWSQFSQSDYSDTQWQRACILDRGTGNTAKERYALPIREPSGALNANGVHAAAVVLAGGRGGVNAPPSAKKAAARKLVSAYRQIGETPPDSLTRLAG